MGHAAVAVLDGGLQGWEAQGLPLAAGEASGAPATSSDFVMQPALVSLASTEEEQDLLDDEKDSPDQGQNHDCLAQVHGILS